MNLGHPREPHVIEQIGLLTTDPRWAYIESPLLMEFALTVLDALKGSAKPADKKQEE